MDRAFKYLSDILLISTLIDSLVLTYINNCCLLSQKSMRFILVYKYGILQTKTERIDVNFCQNTQQLLQYLQKRVGQSPRNFIVRIKKGKVNYRIVGGWPITHYGIKQGMQINIELIQEVQSQNQGKNMNVNKRYLNNILGFHNTQTQQMTQVKQEENQQQAEEQQFNVRKYLDSECEKMLKQIQKKDKQAFLDVFQDYPEDIEEEQLIQIQKVKPYIIDQLGEKGWGALHYAIFCKANDIFDELLDMQVDVNKCTSDGWLPIQLAMDLRESYFIEKLLAQPTINLNLVTSRGSPIHQAAKQGIKEYLIMLLDKDIDINIKDNHGKTAIQICTDQQCTILMRKYEDKKQTYHQYVKGNLPLSLTTIVRGVILKAKRPFMGLKERYLLIDPFQGSMIRYEKASDFPKVPKQITPLNKLNGLKIIEKEDMAFYMKKQLFYFTIEQPNKEIYACKYKQTAQKWLQNIKQAVKFAQQLQKNPHLISQIKKNELIVQDKPEQIQKLANKKVKKNIFNIALGNRNSRSSTKSYQDKPQAVHTTTTQKPNLPANNIKQAHVAKDEVIEKQKQKTQVKQQSRSDVILDRKAEIQQTKKDLTRDLNEITTNKVNYSSFTILNTLGSGAFGKVLLAKLNINGSLYALKALKKKNLILQKQLKYAIIEANILKQANHQFIINLHFAFQTPHYLYLALDYCPGRDLSFHLAREVTFPEEQAKFYIAELCLAIEHLHQKNIIYRDLKPENILLDGKGHIKLADFGLSKQTNDDKTKSFCGSPAYLSPEMLNQKGAGKQSDLYGIGAVLYEFLIGQPPYFSDDIPTLYKNIKQGKLKFPKNVSQTAKSFITGLLERDPKKRLGAKSWSHIKQHAFFNSVDWQKLVNLQIKPPERPQVQQQEGSDDELDIIKNNNANNTKFNDFDYDESTKKINRLMNFSFIRAQ